MELLHCENVGEKAPKANWISALLGLIVLISAYIIAVSIQQPLSAMIWFVIAVIMVILATYLLFVSGSVACCKLLQKNKRYYYRPNHFVSVSSMAYRMKRNGAGLASICILITMVFVTISATLSMYIGAEDSLQTMYPKDITLRMYIPSMEDFTEESFSFMRNGLNEIVPQKENYSEYAGIEIAGLFTDNGMIVDYSSHTNFDLSTYENVGYLHIISLQDYNAMMGTDHTLKPNECFLHCYRTTYQNNTFTIENGTPVTVKEILNDMYVSSYAAMLVPTVTLVTDDIQTFISPIQKMEESKGSLMERFWNCEFNVSGTAEEKIEICQTINRGIQDFAIRTESSGYGYSLNCKEEERTFFFGTYAGLLFVGILLSTVFLFAAILMIYYKQISEGYEDQKRFAILQKVGMTRQDIRRSINSQILTVFFLPLLLAGSHLAFAFPILWKLLQLFSFHNMTLMISVTAATFILLALIYALVYKITSRAYYTIVTTP